MAHRDLVHQDFRPRVHVEDRHGPHSVAVIAILLLGLAAIGGEIALLPKSQAHVQTYAQTPKVLHVSR